MQWFDMIGLKREEVYLTNAVKCLSNPTPKPESIERCRDMVLLELKAVKPILTVLLGDVALKSVCPTLSVSIGAVRGKMLWNGERVYLALFHPAAALHKPELDRELKADFLKVPVALAKAIAMRGG